MAKTTKKRAKNEPDWRRVLSAAALFLAVFGSLLLGAILQADPDPPIALDETSVDPGDEPIRTAPSGETSAPPAAVEPGLGIPFVGDDDLVDRVAEDERRLHASGNGYTLQFAVLCETGNVRTRLEELQSHQDFYLLTMLHQDRACFRLCWGFYDSERQARADRKIPAPLLSITRDPKVISIAEALP